MKYTTLASLYEISNGNLGAITALSEMYDYDKTTTLELQDKLKEIGMTGSKLWVAYKYCKMNVKKLLKKIKDTDKKMIDHINKIVRQGGCGNSKEIII